MPTFFYRRLYGVSTTLDFPLFSPSDGQAVTDAAHASGDVTLVKDEGTPATFTGGFTDEGQSYSLSPAFGDVSCKRAVFEIIDQTAPKAWLDTFLIVETEHDELAQHNRTPGVILETTIASVTDAANFIITTKPNDNNTLLSSVAVVIDASTPDTPPDRSSRNVIAYTGSTGAVQLSSNLVFTPAAGDKIAFYPTAEVATGAQIAALVAAFALSGETTPGSLSKAIQDIETGVGDNATAIDANGDALAALDIKLDTTPQTTARLLRARKNAVFNDIPFKMIDSADQVSGKTGLTVTVQRSIDGGAFGSGTGTVTERANGLYHYDASAADMNGDSILFRFTGTGALPTELTILTTP